jgi:hypothetical protein
MVEIKIEKKKLLWPWILLGLGVIAVLIYFLTFDDYNGQTNEVPKTSKLIGTKETDIISERIVTKETDLINVKENNNTVEAYINFVEISKNRMSLDHAYTNEALSKLIKATNAMAGEVGYDVRAYLEKVMEYAEKITKDPFNTTHADNIRKAKVLTNQIDYNTFVKARRFNRGAEIDRDYELFLFRHYIHDDTMNLAILDDGFYDRKEFENSLHQKNS